MSRPIRLGFGPNLGQLALLVGVSAQRKGAMS